MSKGPLEFVVFRHGIAMDRDDPACPPEADRPLTPKGIDRTHRAARGLARLGVAPLRVISSPWQRARHTAEIAIEELGLDQSMLELNEALLPFAPASAILEEIDRGPVLLVGHAPHLDSVLSLGLGAGTGPLPWLKKAGAAMVRGDQLVWFRDPRALRELGDQPEAGSDG